MKLILRRHESTEDGVFGQLFVPGMPALHTVEDDDLGNQKGVSCIPTGTYLLRRTIYHRHGYETFEVTRVPNRTRILIHPANTEEDVEGCIGIGLRRGVLTVRDEDAPGGPVVRAGGGVTPDTRPMVEKRAVVASREAFRRFMEQMKLVDEATLQVEWGLPPLKVA